MKSRFIAMTLIGALIAFPAFALDLHGARASGAVGEQLDGYAAALQSTPDVTALVANVNAKRKAEYAKISAKNGQPVDVVAKLAAQQIIGQLGAGESYQAADGSWKKK